MITEARPLDAGLCALCRHARVIRSDRGSVFYLCERALSEPGYAKYPRLPVLECRGYERNEPPREQPQ